MITFTGFCILFIGAVLVTYDIFIEILSLPELTIVAFLAWLVAERLDKRIE